MPSLRTIFDLSTERSILRTSIAVTILVSALGVGFGLISGSYAIIFDGVYSVVDACMSILSLIVVNLITSFQTSTLSKKMRERFSMGFWHLEPIVLGLNGTLLIGVAAYALINAVSSILSGGRQLEFGMAIVYAAVTLAIAATTAIAEARANRKLNSQFIALDVKGWIMSTGITAALLIAFGIGYLVQGTSYAWISPYIDPTVLAIVCALIIPIPLSTVRQALTEIFLFTPVDLKTRVDAISKATVEKYGFLSHRAYVARVGRATDIELYFIVKADQPARTITEWDALRDEVGDAIGDDTPDRWLTIVFTADLEWAE